MKMRVDEARHQHLARHVDLAPAGIAAEGADDGIAADRHVGLNQFPGDQVEDPPDPDVLVEEAVGALVQAMDDVLDAGDVGRELTAHLRLVPGQ